LPLGRLPEALERIPRGKPLVVNCQSGGRAAVAIGVLQANGLRDASHLAGDFAEWSAEQLPVDKGGGVPAAV
jgi:hydroxyacylglutathione hydrolase